MLSLLHAVCLKVLVFFWGGGGRQYADFRFSLGARGRGSWSLFPAKGEEGVCTCFVVVSVHIYMCGCMFGAGMNAY